MNRLIHVTGFGPFLDVDNNHTGELARELAPENHTILPVSYSEVESFIREYKLNNRQPLLMLGIARKAEEIHIERTAKNLTCNLPDVDGVELPKTQLSMTHPGALSNPLATQVAFSCSASYFLSDDAGSYLCNYIYFRAQSQLEHIPCLFVHVPPIERMPYKDQLESLQDVYSSLSNLL